ncbi:MAG: PTS sugar transporter subunit IIA [Planctomycetota bacterium]
MRLFNALGLETIAAKAKLADKDEGLREVVRLAKASPLLKDVPEEAILEGLKQREVLGSTGFGGGIAIPHCRLEGVGGFVMGLISVEGEGMDFEAMDGEPVRLIAFMIGPESEPDEHIHLLSAISQAMLVPGAVEEMASAATPEALRESFLRHVRDELEIPEEEGGRHLFQVLVQEEDLFHDILQVFSGIESARMVVVTAQNAGTYLSRIPLFADLWSDHSNRNTQVIVAVVSKQISNETIRRIERITGPLSRRRDVLLVVQDIYYCRGAIEK